MDIGDANGDQDSLSSSEGADFTMCEGIVECGPQGDLIATLKEDKRQLEQMVAEMNIHVAKLEIKLCKLRTSVLPEQDEESEEWQQMHSHCTSSTCWRQKYAESLMQLRAALVEMKNELETQPCKPADEAAKRSDLRMIEESLRSIGPVEPIVKNLKRPSNTTGPHVFKSPRLAPSESNLSLARRPFFKRVIGIFRRTNA